MGPKLQRCVAYVTLTVLFILVCFSVLIDVTWYCFIVIADNIGISDLSKIFKVCVLEGGGVSYPFLSPFLPINVL